MRLYVAGQSPRSVSAIANLRRICDEYVPGRYEVEIVNLLRDPELAKTDQIVAIPASSEIADSGASHHRRFVCHGARGGKSH